jgi:hypothetical protein
MLSELGCEVGLSIELEIIITYCSFGFDIKTRLILVKYYNGVISVRLWISVFTCVHLIYTNNNQCLFDL